MLIPHLHFDGNCAKVIALYEKVFNTKAGADSTDYSSLTGNFKDKFGVIWGFMVAA